MKSAFVIEFVSQSKSWSCVNEPSSTNKQRLYHLFMLVLPISTAIFMPNWSSIRLMPLHQNADNLIIWWGQEDIYLKMS